MFKLDIKNITKKNVNQTLRTALEKISQTIYKKKVVQKQKKAQILNNTPKELVEILIEISKTLDNQHLNSAIAQHSKAANGKQSSAANRNDTQRLNQKDQKTVEKLLRIFIFLLERHYIASELQKDFLSLTEIIKLISKHIGFTPSMLNTINIPDPKYLPTHFKNTQEKWKKTPCLNPGRQTKSIEQGKLVFFTRDSRAAIRHHLADKEKESNREVTILGAFGQTNTLYVNHTDSIFYQQDLLHVDHFLSSQSIINRLQEMIDLMNYDCTLANEIMNAPSSGYFERNKEKKIVGTCWLYLAYYNAIENLWFLLASQNTGQGKNAKDPIEWLETCQIGQQYLEYLKKNNLSIDKRYIIYMVSDGFSLKDSFINWVKLNKKRLIGFYKMKAESDAKLNETTINSPPPNFWSALAYVNKSNQNIKDLNHLGGISSPESDEKPKMAARYTAKMNTSKEWEELQELTKDLEIRFAIEVKQEIKAGKLPDPGQDGKIKRKQELDGIDKNAKRRRQHEERDRDEDQQKSLRYI